MATNFICPYTKAPVLAERPCCVESCSFNLSDVPISRLYRRCFLNYVKATSHNPYKKDELEQVEFGALPLDHREQIARIFLDMSLEDEVETKRLFYISLFSCMAHDTAASLTKRQHDPIRYQQCCVCGQSYEKLWFPKGGVLPDGHGYCSWACWQETPPPLLSLSKMLEVDFNQMIELIPFPQGGQSRLIFSHLLTKWILGDTLLI